MEREKKERRLQLVVSAWRWSQYASSRRWGLSLGWSQGRRSKWGKESDKGAALCRAQGRLWIVDGTPCHIVTETMGLEGP